MKFGKLLFLALLCVASFMFDSFALTKVDCPNSSNVSTVGPGRFKMTSKCYKCPDGCYCTGNLASLDPNDKISGSEVENWCKRSSNSCSGHNSQQWWYENKSASSNKYELYTYGLSSYKKCPKKKNENCTSVNYSNKSDYACGLSNTSNIFRCPADYPNSSAETKTKNDCKNTFSCTGGYYVEAGSGNCNKICPNGSYCKSGSVEAKFSKTENKYSCPSVTSGYSYKSGTGWKSLSECTEVKSYSSISSNCSSGELQRSANPDTRASDPWKTATSTLKAKAGYKVTGSGNDRTCSACGDGYYNTADTNTSCTACTSVSGWNTHTTSTTSTSYNQCYITQTPTNCVGGTVKKVFDHYEGSDKVVYKSTPEVKDALSSKAGYYVNGAACTICPVGTYYAGGNATSCTPVSDGYCASTNGTSCIGSGKTGATTQVACGSKFSNSEHTDCVPCTGSGEYAQNGNCKTCPTSGVPDTNSFYKKDSSSVNNAITECRYGIKTGNCSAKDPKTNTEPYNGFKVIYKYNGSSYQLDTENPPYAPRNYYVSGDTCEKCSDYNESKAYSNGGKNLSAEKCFSCGSGHCITSAGVCTDCTAGFACAAVNGAAQQCKFQSSGKYGVEMCAKDSFSMAKQSSCTKCAVGYTTAKVTNKCSGGSSGACCWETNPNKGCALFSDDATDEMCKQKLTNICYIGNGGSCNPSFSWPTTGLSVGRVDMTYVKIK